MTEKRSNKADVDMTFANNTLHSLFSHVEMFLNGKLISSSNKNYHHLVIETELTTDLASKLTWAPCQGYKNRANVKANQEVKEKAERVQKRRTIYSRALWRTTYTFWIVIAFCYRVLHFICAFTDPQTIAQSRAWVRGRRQTSSELTRHRTQ